MIPFILPVAPKRKYSAPILQIRTLRFRVLNTLYKSDISEEAELDSYTDPVDEKGSGGVGGCAMCSGKSSLSPHLWEGESRQCDFIFEASWL